MGKILGIDFGTNSLGWCIINKDKDENTTEIIDLGSYIYMDGREQQKHESLSKTRTTVRGARKNRDRRKIRLGLLRNKLTQFGLFPKTNKEKLELKTLDVFEIRNKAVSEKISPYELGRCLYHICRHRGFKSNRKTPLKEEEKKLAKETTLFDENGEITTIGQLLYSRIGEGKCTRIKDDSGLYFTRKQYEDEFDKILETQAKFHNLTTANWKEIKDIMFSKRELKPQMVGKCEFLFEEREERIAKAMPTFQKVKIWLDINNLAYSTSGDRKNLIGLDEEKRKKLFNILNGQKTITFGKITKELALPEDSFFNLDKDAKRKGLIGNTTAVILSDEKLFGNVWFKLSNEKQDEVMEKILDSQQDEELKNYLKSQEFKLADSNIDEIVKLTAEKFEKGYGKICQKFLLKMLPHLENGKKYFEAVELGAKDLGKQLKHSGNFDGVIYEEMPPYQEILSKYLGGQWKHC